MLIIEARLEGICENKTPERGVFIHLASDSLAVVTYSQKSSPVPSACSSYPRERGELDMSVPPPPDLQSQM